MKLEEQETLSVDFGVEHDCCGLVRPGDCPDLIEEFGMTYRVEYEDPVFRGSRCPWHVRIPCRYGWIAPSDRKCLYAYCRGRNRGRLKALAEAQPDKFTVVQEGDVEIGVKFELEFFGSIGEILVPKGR